MLNVSRCPVNGGQIRLGIQTPFAWARQLVAVFRGAAPTQRYQVLVNEAEIGSWTRGDAVVRWRAKRAWIGSGLTANGKSRQIRRRPTTPGFASDLPQAARGTARP